MSDLPGPTSDLARAIHGQPGAGATHSAPQTIRLAVGLTDWNDIGALAAELRPEKHTNLFVVANATTMIELYDAARQHDADAVLFSPRLPGFEQSGAELIQKLYHHDDHPIVAIAVIPPGAGDWARSMEQLGVAGHVVSPLRAEEIARLIELIPQAVLRAYQDRRSATYIPRLDQRTAAIVAQGGWKKQTIVVWSPKGGVGKTVLAVNLAILFGVIANRPTALVDADMDTGDTFMLLDGGVGDPGHTIYHLAEEYMRQPAGSPLLASTVKPYLAPYRGSLQVLRGVFNATEGTMDHLVNERAFAFMTDLLKVLEGLYDFTVVDLGLSCSHPIHLAALARADVVLVIVAPENTAAFRAYSHEAPLQLEMEIDPARFKLVFNKWVEGKVDRKQVVDLVKLSEFIVIPHDDDFQVLDSINEQKPLVLCQPKLDVTRQIVTLATHFYPPLRDIWQQYDRRDLGEVRTDRSGGGWRGGWRRRRK
jgi:pilus assembly protein CpaE